MTSENFSEQQTTPHLEKTEKASLRDILKDTSLTNPRESEPFSETKITSGRNWRANLKSAMTGLLALALWLLLAGVVIWQILSIGKLVEPNSTPSTAEQKELLDKKSTLINETAKTLYTFLGPLITAATSFYFSSSLNRDSNDDD